MTMNKKTYIAPVANVIEMECLGMICTSGEVGKDDNLTPGEGTTNPDPEGGEPLGAKEHNFDLWD